MKWQIILFLMGIMITTKLVLADGFGQCNFGSYTFGNCVTPPKQIISGEGGGLGGSGIVPLSVSNPFGTSPINDTCLSTQQLLDGRCYDCDPVRGYLKFRPDDRSVLCVLCSTNSILINDTCVRLNQINQTLLHSTLDEYGARVNPKNPIMGMLLIVFVGIISLIGLGYSLKKPQKKYKIQEQEEENKLEEEL